LLEEFALIYKSFHSHLLAKRKVKFLSISLSVQKCIVEEGRRSFQNNQIQMIHMNVEVCNPIPTFISFAVDVHIQPQLMDIINQNGGIWVFPLCLNYLNSRR